MRACSSASPPCAAAAAAVPLPPASPSRVWVPTRPPVGEKDSDAWLGLELGLG